MIRDEELNRLIKYAQGMGLSVSFRPYKPFSLIGGEWTTDGTELIVYVEKDTTKIEKVLILIHEISHHKAYINNDRENDPILDNILDKDDPNKKERYKIWRSEVRDSKYWEEIYKDTNCKFDIKKLHARREFDLWQYEFCYENDRDPTKEEKYKKFKELKNKYKC